MGTTSPRHDSFWMESAPAQTHQPLQSRATAEVVVIGAGITGLTTGYLLACVLVDRTRATAVDDSNGDRCVVTTDRGTSPPMRLCSQLSCRSWSVARSSRAPHRCGRT